MFIVTIKKGVSLNHYFYLFANIFSVLVNYCEGPLLGNNFNSNLNQYCISIFEQSLTFLELLTFRM